LLFVTTACQEGACLSKPILIQYAVQSGMTKRSIFLPNPMQRITGMSGRMFRISLSSLSPVILGIVRSVIIKSNSSGLKRSLSNTSIGFMIAST
jgi:hypothetical protein